MSLFVAETSKLIPVPVATVYAIIADYRNYHPRIQPPSITNYQVLYGGFGDGTIFRCDVTIHHRTQSITVDVREPEPGRVIVHAFRENGWEHRFHLEPVSDRTRLTISLQYELPDILTSKFEAFIMRRRQQQVVEGTIDRIITCAATFPAE